MAKDYSLRKGDRVAIVADFIEEVGDKYRVTLVGAEKLGPVEVPKGISRLLERAAYPGDRVLLRNGLKGTYLSDVNDKIATVLLDGGDEDDPGSYMAVQKATLFAEDQTGANRFVSVKREGDEEHRQSRIAQEREIQEISDRGSILSLEAPAKEEAEDQIYELLEPEHFEAAEESASDESVEEESEGDEDRLIAPEVTGPSEDNAVEEDSPDGETREEAYTSKEAVHVEEDEKLEDQEIQSENLPESNLVEKDSGEADITVEVPEGYGDKDFQIRQRHRDKEGFPALSSMLGGIAKAINSEAQKTILHEEAEKRHEEAVESEAEKEREGQESSDIVQDEDKSESSVQPEMTPERQAHLEQLRKNMLKEIGIKPVEAAESNETKSDPDDIDDIFSAIEDLDRK